MRGSVVVLALALTPFVSNAQARPHWVRHETAIAHHDNDSDHGKSDDKKCEDRQRGNPSQNGLDHRADPRDKGNKDCSTQSGGGSGGSGGSTQPPPAPAPVGHTSVFGSVFFDIDHDGALGPDEVGLAGWTVMLTGPVSMTTTTDGNGGYSFSGLNAGTYLVCVVPPMGWTQTAIAGSPSCGSALFGYTVDAASLAVDVSYTGMDFGFVSN
jgi:hypothetical protein